VQQSGVSNAAFSPSFIRFGTTDGKINALAEKGLGVLRRARHAMA
jgi:hypothetical protein